MYYLAVNYVKNITAHLQFKCIRPQLTKHMKQLQLPLINNTIFCITRNFLTEVTILCNNHLP